MVPLGDQAGADQGPGSRSIREAYLELLLHRGDRGLPSGPPLSTVYIGGGTPSLLTVRIRSVQCSDSPGGASGFSPVRKSPWKWIPPALISSSCLQGYLRAGVNRVSLGGQSFDDAVLEQLGRRHRQRTFRRRRPGCSRRASTDSSPVGVWI